MLRHPSSIVSCDRTQRCLAQAPANCSGLPPAFRPTGRGLQPVQFAQEGCKDKFKQFSTLSSLQACGGPAN